MDNLTDLYYLKFNFSDIKRKSRLIKLVCLLLGLITPAVVTISDFALDLVDAATRAEVGALFFTLLNTCIEKLSHIETTVNPYKGLDHVRRLNLFLFFCHWRHNTFFYLWCCFGLRL